MFTLTISEWLQKSNCGDPRGFCCANDRIGLVCSFSPLLARLLWYFEAWSVPTLGSVSSRAMLSVLSGSELLRQLKYYGKPRFFYCKVELLHWKVKLRN